MHQRTPQITNSRLTSFPPVENITTPSLTSFPSVKTFLPDLQRLLQNCLPIRVHWCPFVVSQPSLSTNDYLSRRSLAKAFGVALAEAEQLSSSYSTTSSNWLPSTVPLSRSR